MTNEELADALEELGNYMREDDDSNTCRACACPMDIEHDGLCPFGIVARRLRERIPRYDCAECGKAIAVDEDGCCWTCGRDATLILHTEGRGRSWSRLREQGERIEGYVHKSDPQAKCYRIGLSKTLDYCIPATLILHPQEPDDG